MKLPLLSRLSPEISQAINLRAQARYDKRVSELRLLITSAGGSEETMEAILEASRSYPQRIGGLERARALLLYGIDPEEIPFYLYNPWLNPESMLRNIPNITEEGSPGPEIDQ